MHTEIHSGGKKIRHSFSGVFEQEVLRTVVLNQVQFVSHGRCFGSKFGGGGDVQVRDAAIIEWSKQQRFIQS